MRVRESGAYPGHAQSALRPGLWRLWKCPSQPAGCFHRNHVQRPQASQNSSRWLGAFVRHCMRRMVWRWQLIVWASEHTTGLPASQPCVPKKGTERKGPLGRGGEQHCKTKGSSLAAYTLLLKANWRQSCSEHSEHSVLLMPLRIYRPRAVPPLPPYHCWANSDILERRWNGR